MIKYKLDMIRFLKVTMLILALFVSPGIGSAQNIGDETSSIVSNESTKVFVQDLKRFIRSINKEKYQPEGYWKEVDKLWEALQTRKKDLQGDFTESQRNQIRKLERKYRSLRAKKSKLS